MPLFLKLYLAHLIADFVLQFDELYRLKVRSRWGHILHVFIHFLISCALAAPYLGYRSVELFIVSVTLIHYIQDHIKYRAQKDRHKMFAAFVIDQILHLLVISTVFVLPESRLTLGIPEHAFLDALYRNPYWTKLSILFILATFGGSYLLHAFKRAYFENTRPDYGITRLEMSHDLVERSVVAFGILAAPNALWLSALPLVGVLRLPFLQTRNWTDFILSLTYAAFLGWIFKIFLGFPC
ncbi:MAG: DUF3307 domain-containing protein [Candidatus Omnitrophota bacterium]|jgi:hypothetical protein